MSPRAIIYLLFTVVAVISPTVYGSLTITDHEYPLMHFTKLISEEHFTPGQPLAIMLPITPLGAALAPADSSNKEAGYLIEELHTSGRWPILVYNVGYKINGNMDIEIQQHGSYIILISGPCTEWGFLIISFSQQALELIFGNITRQSWNPRAKFFVSVMSNCTQFDNKIISRAILEKLWSHNVMNAAVPEVK